MWFQNYIVKFKRKLSNERAYKMIRLCKLFGCLKKGGDMSKGKVGTINDIIEQQEIFNITIKLEIYKIKTWSDIQYEQSQGCINSSQKT